MDQPTARLILLGLAQNASSDDKRSAIDLVMSERHTPPSREVRIPVPGGRTVSLQVPTDRFTSDDWRYMMRVFEAIRPGLLTDDEVNNVDLEASDER